MRTNQTNKKKRTIGISKDKKEEERTKKPKTKQRESISIFILFVLWIWTRAVCLSIYHYFCIYQIKMAHLMDFMIDGGFGLAFVFSTLPFFISFLLVHWVRIKYLHRNRIASIIYSNYDDDQRFVHLNFLIIQNKPIGQIDLSQNLDNDEFLQSSIY